ncbi:MAG: 8-oxo-dGTP diphosphatase [Candidatus Nomurabacteria bacterium]|nr:MAG: 8-oxo-dGTP diphosphatase [Candidatus Nomurabacteria bacterium]
MKIVTLALIVKRNKILLGYKKKGEIGTDTLNGPGGKVEPDESIEECLLREVWEEVNIELQVDKIEKLGVITFFDANTPDFEVHIFRTEHFIGIPVETADMIPDWYEIDNLPLGKMLESDREWFEKMAKGEKFNAHVFYKNRAADFDRIEFLPFS